MNNKNKKYIFVIGASGLIFTHNLMTLCTVIFSVIYLCCNYNKINKKVILDFLINMFAILAITSCFWVQILENMNFSEYAVYQKGMMATIESVRKSGLNLKQLFITSQDAKYVFEIDLPCIISLIGTILVFRKIKEKRDYILFLSLGLFCVFMSTKYFPWAIVGEYFPQKANSNRDYLSLREDKICTLDGDGKIEFEDKNGQKLNSKIDVFEKNTVLELPYIYYPGYKVYVDNIEVDYFESDNGFISIFINEKGEHDVSVSYSGTLGMQFSKYFSIISMLIFSIFIIVYKKMNKNFIFANSNNE